MPRSPAAIIIIDIIVIIIIIIIIIKLKLKHTIYYHYHYHHKHYECYYYSSLFIRWSDTHFNNLRSKRSQHIHACLSAHVVMSFVSSGIMSCRLSK